jgi:hypothetical protein
MGALYGSFDYGNSHFIALNTDPIIDGTVHEGEIDPEQLAWLTSDLQANAGVANISVILHHYVFGPPGDNPALDTGFATIAGRDALHAIFVKYHVRAVFCGHDHLYWHGVRDGIDYFISGGAGAPLDATPDQGGFLHYVVVTVNSATFTTQILQPWHLEVDYPDGDGKGLTAERVWVSNTNYLPVTANHIVLHMATPPPGEQYLAQASVTYKGKNKPDAATIVSVTPDSSPNSLVVVVSCLIPKARTVEIVVTGALKLTHDAPVAVGLR